MRVWFFGALKTAPYEFFHTYFFLNCYFFYNPQPTNKQVPKHPLFNLKHSISCRFDFIERVISIYFL